VVSSTHQEPSVADDDGDVTYDGWRPGGTATCHVNWRGSGSLTDATMIVKLK
jgi:hypothetical protein